jgi:cobalt/nickel transport system ATP-binding protein
MSENILEVQNLCYSYPDGTPALKGVNICIKKGQTTAIIGGNGAGKSTLFLNLNGILKPSSGQILYDGEPVEYSQKGLKNLRRGVGLVFQDPDNQLFSASVYQDVSFGAVNLKLPEEEIYRRVNTAMERTGIQNLKDKPTHCLSFGQKKRAAIAGVLVMEPDLLVLDEPTAGLDPKGLGEIMTLLKETQVQLGISVVIATHDIDIVPLYCDYVYVIDNGEIVLEGTPKEVFSQAEVLRRVHLRLPRIAHLMEILQREDDFAFDDISTTISEARKELKKWRDDTCK